MFFNSAANSEKRRDFDLCHGGIGFDSPVFFVYDSCFYTAFLSLRFCETEVAFYVAFFVDVK